MDIFREKAIVTRACFSAVKPDYERLLGAYQRLFGRNISGSPNDRYGSVNSRSFTGVMVDRKVPDGDTQPKAMQCKLG